MLTSCIALVAALAALSSHPVTTEHDPRTPAVDVSMLGVGPAPTLADLTVGDVSEDEFGCTPCSSYAYVDVHYPATGNWENVTLSTPGQIFVSNRDDGAHSFSLKIGVPSIQEVGWCNPHHESGNCVPMAPCPASFWGHFQDVGNTGYGMRDMDAPFTPWTTVPSGTERSRDCGEQADIRIFEIWWTNPQNIINDKKLIATVIVAYGCSQCVKVYPTETGGTGGD